MLLERGRDSRGGGGQLIQSWKTKRPLVRHGRKEGTTKNHKHKTRVTTARCRQTLRAYTHGRGGSEQQHKREDKKKRTLRGCEETVSTAGRERSHCGWAWSLDRGGPLAYKRGRKTFLQSSGGGKKEGDRNRRVENTGISVTYQITKTPMVKKKKKKTPAKTGVGRLALL